MVEIMFYFNLIHEVESQFLKKQDKSAANLSHYFLNPSTKTHTVKITEKKIIGITNFQNNSFSHTTSNDSLPQ